MEMSFKVFPLKLNKSQPAGSQLKPYLFIHIQTGRSYHCLVMSNIMMIPLQFLYTSRNSASRATSSDCTHTSNKGINHMTPGPYLVLHPWPTCYKCFLNTWQPCDNHLLGLILQFQVLSTLFAFAWRNKEWQVLGIADKKRHHSWVCCFRLDYGE